MILKDVVVVFSCLLLDQCSYHWDKNDNKPANSKLLKQDVVHHRSFQNLDKPIKLIQKKHSTKKIKKLKNKNKYLEPKENFVTNGQQTFSQHQRFVPVQPVEPVKVEVFFESLCPDSRAFIKNQLWPTYNELYSTGIFQLSMYAYGNAQSAYNKRKQRWDFSCQHGEEECHFNLIESCVVLNYPNPVHYFPYIKCLETNPSDELAKECAVKMNMKWKKILACTKSKKGNDYQYKVGGKTPEHTFIPWILINGQGSETINSQALNNLKGLICSTYTGNKPKQCATMEPILYY